MGLVLWGLRGERDSPSTGLAGPSPVAFPWGVSWLCPRAGSGQHQPDTPGVPTGRLDTTVTSESTFLSVLSLGMAMTAMTVLTEEASAGPWVAVWGPWDPVLWGGRQSTPFLPG